MSTKKATKKNPATKKVQAKKPTMHDNVRVLMESFESQAEFLIDWRKRPDDKVDMLGHRLTKLESPAPPAEVKEEPLKVGYWVAWAKDVEGVPHPPTGVGKVLKVGRSAYSDQWFADVDLGKGVISYWAHNLRKLSKSEVSAHLKAEEERKQAEEWAKVGELQEGDACEWTDEQCEEIGAMAKAAGVLHDSWTGTDGRWPVAYTEGYGVHGGGDPKMYCYSIISFAEFKRRLLGTIKKIAEEARAKELAIPLEICKTRVRYAGHEGVYLGPHGTQHEIGRPNGSGTWTVSVCDRDSFTVIPD